MLDLFDEFQALLAGLSEGQIAYALCGGLAMAVYGIPRATLDIDLLIPDKSLDAVLDVARKLGYTFEAQKMSFAGGKIEIRRVSKLDSESGDVLTLDLLVLTPAIRKIWESRIEVEWEKGKLWVVSREGLIALKSLRASGQDLDDIKRLQEDEDES